MTVSLIQFGMGASVKPKVPPVFVQKVQTPPAGGTVFHLAITPTAGHLLILGVGIYQHGQIVSVADDQGNVWATAVPSTQAGNAAGGIFYVAACAGGLTNITVTLFDAQVDVALIVHEVSGAAASSPVDATAIGSGATGMVLDTAPLVTTKAQDYLFSLACFVDQNISGIGAGYTLRSNLGTDIWTATGDMIAAAPGSYVGSWTCGINTDWLVMAAAFKAA